MVYVVQKDYKYVHDLCVFMYAYTCTPPLIQPWTYMIVTGASAILQFFFPSFKKSSYLNRCFEQLS